MSYTKKQQETYDKLIKAGASESAAKKAVDLIPADKNEKGNEVEDYLKSIGQSSDINAKKALAKRLAMGGYTGTSQQDASLLGMLKGMTTSEISQIITPESSGDTGDGGDTGGGESGGESKFPSWLENSEWFGDLTPDQQQGAMDLYNVQVLQDEEDQELLLQAYEDAEAQADPYFAEQLRMAKDELTRALGGQADDFASKQRDLQLKIDQIKEDLVTGKDRLSVDQQAELARREREYGYELETLTENAASAGLTFSSKRALAEGRLATEQSDIIESTKREFQRKIIDLQQAAARGETGAQNLLNDYEEMYGENVTNLIRTTERFTGTSGLPSLPELEGVSPLGGVVGTMARTKSDDIKTRADQLFEQGKTGSNLTNPFL